MDNDSRSHFILGTAGHIDHGKTALVMRLTGTDTDRLPEEKQRGMTIELGFAELLIGDTQFGVVDVPGHERFVRTMVVGASGIDIALLVVAADDSVMPQTREHVEILDLLGITHGVVAITKSDLVDDEMRALVAEEIAELLADTSLVDAPVVEVSSVTGHGIEELKSALLAQSRSCSRSHAGGSFRLCIDRVFVVQGRGTVVTGSTLSGEVHPDDQLELLPRRVGCRVRGVQSHGRDSSLVRSGQRTAVNLSGIDRDQIERGMELATPGSLQPTTRLDATVRCLGSVPRPIRSHRWVRLCMGTRETMVRVTVLGGDRVDPGQQAFVQMRCAEPLVAAWGQKFICRDETAARTIGGGIVLRPVSRRLRAGDPALTTHLGELQSSDPLRRVAEVLRFAGFGQLGDLQIAARSGVEPGQLNGILERLQADGVWVRLGKTDQLCTTAAIRELSDRALRWLERFHQSHLDEPGCLTDSFVGWLDRKAGKGLGKIIFTDALADKVKVLGKYVCLPQFAPELSAQDEKLLVALVDEYYESAFQPPTLKATKVAAGTNLQRVKRLAKIAAATGALVHISGDFFLHNDREEDMRRIVAELIGERSGATVAQIKEALQSSRKFVVPLLEYLDRVKYTRRQDDLRFLVEGEKS